MRAGSSFFGINSKGSRQLEDELSLRCEMDVLASGEECGDRARDGGPIPLTRARSGLLRRRVEKDISLAGNLNALQNQLQSCEARGSSRRASIDYDAVDVSALRDEGRTVKEERFGGDSLKVVAGFVAVGGESLFDGDIEQSVIRQGNVLEAMRGEKLSDCGDGDERRNTA